VKGGFPFFGKRYRYGNLLQKAVAEVQWGERINQRDGMPLEL